MRIPTDKKTDIKLVDERIMFCWGFAPKGRTFREQYERERDSYMSIYKNLHGRGLIPAVREYVKTGILPPDFLPDDPLFVELTDDDREIVGRGVRIMLWFADNDPGE